MLHSRRSTCPQDTARQQCRSFVIVRSDISHRMSQPAQNPAAPTPDQAARRHRIRKESILAGICLGIGLIVLPALIYGFGSTVLGAYGGGPHLGSFYGDYIRNLASGTFRTWLIVLTPYLTVLALRLIFRPQRLPIPWIKPPPEAGASDASAQSSATAERREPFVSP
jgi:hypothetical protein